MYSKISMDQLYTNKEQLLTFSRLNVYDIKDLYKIPTDIDIINCDDFECITKMWTDGTKFNNDIIF